MVAVLAFIIRYSGYLVLLAISLYAIRHYWFTLNRLFGFQRHPYVDIDTADWPRVTVLIPAHNEELVIGQLLTALLDVNYPQDRLLILPINDRSNDRTGEIIDDFARRYPDRVKPFHRRSEKGGKAAALSDAMDMVEDEIVLVFDADYIPGRGLIKQLVAPFFDPGVGAVMGRVVPWNVGRNPGGSSKCRYAHNGWHSDGPGPLYFLSVVCSADTDELPVTGVLLHSGDGDILFRVFPRLLSAQPAWLHFHHVRKLNGVHLGRTRDHELYVLHF